jgi:hypothetical protein
MAHVSGGTGTCCDRSAVFCRSPAGRRRRLRNRRPRHRTGTDAPHLRHGPEPARGRRAGCAGKSIARGAAQVNRHRPVVGLPLEAWSAAHRRGSGAYGGPAVQACRGMERRGGPARCSEHSRARSIRCTPAVAARACGAGVKPARAKRATAPAQGTRVQSPVQEHLRGAWTVREQYTAGGQAMGPARAERRLACAARVYGAV